MCQPTTLKTQEKKANENQIIVQQQQEQQQEQQMPMHRDIQGNQLNVGQKMENKEEIKRSFKKSPIISEFETLADIRAQVKSERESDIFTPGSEMSADSYVAQETTTAIEILKRLDHRYKNTAFSESMPETVKEAHGFRKYILTDEERKQIKKAKNLEMDIQASEDIQEILKKADQQCANVLGKALQRENALLKLGYGEHSKEERKNLQEMEEQTQVDGAVLSALWSNQYQNIYYGAEKEVDKKKKIRVGGVNQIAALAGSTMGKTRSFDEKNVKKRKDYKAATPEQQEAIVNQYKHIFNIYQTMRSKGNEINQAKSGVQNNSLLDAEQVVKIKRGNGEDIEFKWNPQEIKHNCNLTVSQEELIPVVKEESEDRKALLDFENATAEQLQKALEAPAKGSFDFAAASSTSLLGYVNSLNCVMQRELWRFCALKYDIEENDRNEKAFEKALKEALDKNGDFGSVKKLVLDEADEAVPINLEVSEFTQSLAVQQMKAMCDYIKEYANKKNTVDAVKENRDEYQKITSLFSAVNTVVNSVSISLKDMKSFEKLPEKEQVEMMTNLSDLFAITSQSEVDLTEKGLQKINDCEKQLSDFLEKKVTSILEKENLKVSDWKECLAGAIKDTNIQEILSKNEEWASCEILYNAAQRLNESATEYTYLMNRMAARDFKIQYYEDVLTARRYLHDCSKKLQNSTMNEEEKKLAEEILSYKAQLKKLRDQDDPETDKQKTEEELIAQGQEIYDTLNLYNKMIRRIKREIRDGKILLERPQARKLIDMAYDLKADYADRIFEEKKEVLACYEGSLILRDMPANKSYKDQKDISAAKKVVDLTNHYEAFRKNCKAFLDRYASVEGTSFYVGKVKTQLEFVAHKIRKAMGATAEDLFNNLDEETKKAVMEPLTKTSYGEKEKEIYKTLMEDNKNREEIALDQYSVKDVMQVVYDFALTQHTFDRAGMDGEAVLKKSFDYKGVTTKLLGKFGRNGALRLNPSLIQSLKNADQEQVKVWIKDAIGKYRDTFMNVFEQYRKSLDNAEIAVSEVSFINQTQLGTQAQVLEAIVKSFQIPVNEDPDFDWFYNALIVIEESNEESKKLMEEDDLPKMQQEAAWETYVRLNQQTGENKEKEAELAAKAYNEKEKDVKKIFESSELKKAIGGVYHVMDGKETPEFKKVHDQLELITGIEMKAYKEKEIDGVRHIVKETDDDYPTLLVNRDEAYRELAVLVRTYITKKGPRSDFFRSSRGIKRLTAMKNLFEALKNYYGLKGDYENLDDLKRDLDDDKVKEKAKKASEELTEKKARAKQAEQKLIADKQIADEYKEALAALKSRYNESVKDGKKLTLEDLYSSNKGVFGRILIQKDRDLFVNAGDGAKFYIELKAFENQLKDDKVKEIWKGAKKLKKECYGKDISQMTEMDRFELWSKCQEFIKENSGEQIPAEAKRMLKEIKVLSENYVSQKEYERMLSEMEKDRVRVSEYAKADNKAYVYVDKFGVQRDPEADMLLLVYKYKMFLKGAKKISNQEHLSKEEKADKNRKISDFEHDILAIENKLKNDVFKNDVNKAIKTAAMKGARRNLDQRLSRLRTLLDNINFIQVGKRVDQDFRTALKDATEEINFYLDTFSDLKTKNGKKKTLWMYLTGKEPELDLEANDLMEYYSAQRDNLRKIMAQTAINNMLDNEIDLLNRDIEDIEAKLKELTKNNVDKNGKVSAKKDQDSKQMQACLKFILEVEVDSKKLGGIKKLGESQPEMAAELQKQMAFRAEYENSLSGLSQEQKDNLREAMNNIAGDYLQTLKKVMKNVDATLTLEDERMNYYYIGFTSAYDHASEFLHLADKWDSGYESGNSKELKKLIRKIDRNTKEVMALYHFKDEDATIRETMENIKVEHVKAAYSTNKVVKQRDHDFEVTMKNLANIRLGSAQDLKINKEIKNQGVKYNQEGYKNLKARNDFYIKEPLFGYVLWGTETYSLDELIMKLYNESMRYDSYEAVEPLINQLMDLKRLAIAMTSKDFLAEEKAKREAKIEELKKAGGKTVEQIERQVERENRYNPQYFKVCVENLNTTVELTYTELHDKVHKMGDRKLSKKNTKFSEAFYKAWKSYYPSLQKLSEQMEGYIDRTQGNVQFMGKVDKFCSAIRADYSDRSEEQRERAYLRALKNAPNYEYAESRREHLLNTRVSFDKERCIQWFENYSFKMAQDVAENFRKLSNNGNNTQKYACLADYYDFMAKIEEYRMQGAIDEKIYTSTKAVVEREVSKQGLRPLSKEQIVEMRAQFAALNELDDIMYQVNFWSRRIDHLKSIGESDASAQRAKKEILESLKDKVEVAYELELNKYNFNKQKEKYEKFMERFNKFSNFAMDVFSDNRVDAQAAVKEEIEKKRKELKKQGFDGEDLENKIDEWIKGNELTSTIMAMRFRWWNPKDWAQKIGNMFV